MDYVLAPFIWLLGTVVALISWIVIQIFWILLWLLLPLLILAFVASRVAESIVGQEKVRAWVGARTRKYGSVVSKRAQRWVFALGAVPIRVLFWFVIYTLWHSIVSLAWRPHWSPWQRAWAKRTRQHAAAPAKS